MSRTVLGISAFYHDSAAAMVRDGEIVAAAQEERFSRKKHDPRFPRNAVNYCLEEAGIHPRELDAVVFYDNPLLTFDRIVKNALTVAPNGREEWIRACRSILGAKGRIKTYLRQILGLDPPLLVTDHHLAHAASAFWPSPYNEAAILTVDGVGEWATTTIGYGRGRQIELLEEIRYPHSLGLLYSAITSFCGFKVNSGEYKLMGLAPYGRPIYADLIREHLVDLKPDGSFRLHTERFGYLDSAAMTNESFHALFGGPPRMPESRITRREMDLAASAQVVLEEAMVRLARHARDLTGINRLVMAGGVALNCVANGKILRECGLEGLWIQPAAGDAGGALGAALLVSHQLLEVEPLGNPDGRDRQKGSYLGPRFGTPEILAFLGRHDYPHQRIEDEEERARTIGAALAEGKVVGYFAGRMEFGPRALGARSILGDPRRPETQSLMNLKIKYRESFRPFAPAVLREQVSDYFELEVESPYMLLIAPVRKKRRLPVGSLDPCADDDMLPIISRARSDVPAITHVDYSARMQTVDRERNPGLYRVMQMFYKMTGCPVLVNTSFNVRGEPIVCTPEDAYRCFLATEMDVLVLEKFIVLKIDVEQKTAAKDVRDNYLAQFKPD